MQYPVEFRRSSLIPHSLQNSMCRRVNFNETFLLVSSLFCIEEKLLEQVCEQNLPEPYEPSCSFPHFSQIIFTYFTFILTMSLPTHLCLFIGEVRYRGETVSKGGSLLSLLSVWLDLNQQPQRSQSVRLTRLAHRPSYSVWMSIRATNCANARWRQY